MNFSVWMCLMISLTAAHREFPQNFVVAKKSEQYTLTCNSKAGEAVTWKLGDNSLEDEDNVELNGPNLTVLEVDMPSLGKYSCWKGEEMLSSTYLLLEDDEEHDLNSLITCRAKSYDCNFSCTWTSNEFTAVRLGLGQDCNESLKSCQWVSSSGQFPDGRLQFELSHNLSPYAEESTMLELTAEAISDRSIFRTTKRFYLRDIVEPDSPHIVRCQLVEQDLTVTIDPPSSWSVPHSFFSLEHEIEYVLRNDGKTRRSLSTLIPKEISKLRVRSRDSVVLSNWSQWTPWKNVTY
ncbi:interleukin-12 subunit beta [Archocentrus centrarchus]|uniref:interleukin-12 subunit beta n=1 Tax=Archocentrus centrarchus TaxID=63155 RepID=UPI0011E9E2EE|nr:interleukin-12 subunit beta-like [Archocentrus centrarchus]